MNSFGLGLVLNFTDNASAGLGRAGNNLRTLSGLADSMSSASDSAALSVLALSATGQGLNMLGDQLMGVGSSILELSSGLVDYTLNIGKTIAGARSQYYQLWGSVEAGEAVLGKVKEYAATSQFEFENLLPIVARYKSSGLEAFDAVFTNAEGRTMNYLDLASDLAAFNPGARSTEYGVGVGAAAGAIKEYVSESNTRNMRTAFGIDILEQVGGKAGATAEERLEQIVGMMEKLNLLGMSASMQGTPSAMLSNMQDVLFNTMTIVADAGVYQKYTDIIRKMYDYVDAIPQEEFVQIAEVLGSAIVSIMTPVEKGLDYLFQFLDWMRELLKTNPALAQWVVTIGSLIGALTLGVGAILKFGGSFFTAAASLKTLTGMSSGIIPIISMITRGFVSLAFTIAPIVALAAIFYTAWAQNLFGFRDAVDTTIGRLIGTFQILFEYFTQGSISYESFELMQRLGIQPLIEGVLLLSERLNQLWTGITEGVMGAIQAVMGFLSAIGFINALDANVFGSFGEFLKIAANPATAEGWANVGRVLGSVGIAVGALMAISKVVGLFANLSSIFSIFNFGGIGGSRGAGPDAGASWLSRTAGFILDPKKVVAGMASLALIIYGFSALVLAFSVLTAIPGFQEFIRDGVKTLSIMFLGAAVMAPGIAALTAFVVAMNYFKIIPMAALGGMINFGIVVGGFAALVLAIGAIALIPGITTALESGINAIKQVLSTITPATIIQFAALAVAMVLLGNISPAIVAKGFAAVAIIISGFALIVAEFGALSMIPGYADFMSTGGDALAQLFGILGRISGNLVGGALGGIGEGLAATLPSIGNSLSQFAENLQPFFASMSNAPLAAIGTFMIDFAQFLTLLTVNEILDFFSGELNLAEVGASLGAFGISIVPFFETMSTVNEAGLQKAPLVFQSLAGMGDSTFKMGGLKGLIFGDTALSELSQQMVEAAPDLISFFNAVALMNDAGMQKTPLLFQAISSIGNSEFNMGGLKALFFGDTAINVIAQQLAEAMPNLNRFFNSVAKVSDEAFNRARSLFNTISVLGTLNFKEGGLVGLITGNSSLSTMGTNLASFMNNAWDFFAKVSSLDQASFNNALLVGDFLAKMGNLTQVDFGDFNTEDMGALGSGLSSLMEGLGPFLVSVGQMNPNSLVNASTLFNSLSTLGNTNLQNIANVDLTSMGYSLSNFMISSQNFFLLLNNVTEAHIATALKMFEMLGTLGSISLRSIDQNVLIDLGYGLSNFMIAAQNFFLLMGMVTESSLTNASLMFNTLGSINTAGLSNILMVDLISVGYALSNLMITAQNFFYLMDIVTAERLSSAQRMFEVLVMAGDLSTLAAIDLAGLGTGLSNFMINAQVFFELISREGLAEGIVSLTPALANFFNTLNTTSPDQIASLSASLIMLQASLVSFMQSLEGVPIDLLSKIATGITSNQGMVTGAISALGLSIANSLNDIASKGSLYGARIMSNIASGVNSQVSAVSSAVQNSLNIALSMVNIRPPQLTVSAPGSVPAFASGGETLGTGMALLHPNEAILNSRTTEGLKSFLEDQHSGRGGFNQTPITSQDSYDYSVNIQPGAIVIQSNGVMTEAEARENARRMMDAIEREQDLRSMARRRYRA